MNTRYLADCRRFMALLFQTNNLIPDFPLRIGASRRLGRTDKYDPVNVEIEPIEIITKSFWSNVSLQFILAGRSVMTGNRCVISATPGIKINL